MTTHFIEAEIDLQEDTQALQKAIETELSTQGETLRWAITKVDQEKQKVHVEAIVTTAERSSHKGRVLTKSL